MALTLETQPQRPHSIVGERHGRHLEKGAGAPGWGHTWGVGTHLGRGTLGEGAAPVHTVMQTLVEHWDGCGMRRIWPDQVLASILRKMFYFIGSFKNSELKNHIEIKIKSH